MLHNLLRRPSATFEKLRKETTGFVTSVRLSVGNGTTRFPLDGIPWNLILENLSRKSEFVEVLKRITGILHEDLSKFTIISPWIIMRMRNISDKPCRENQNRNFTGLFFSKILPFKIMWKIVVELERTQTTTKYGAEKTRLACRMKKTRIQTKKNTHTLLNFINVCFQHHEIFLSRQQCTWNRCYASMETLNNHIFLQLHQSYHV
jgi:hypothetical protein